MFFSLSWEISLVGQEPVLYARSIKENIAYGVKNWSMSSVQQAAKLANAHDFIMGLENKYETESGEKGIQLSGTCYVYHAWLLKSITKCQFKQKSV